MKTQINLRSPFYVKVKKTDLTSVRLDLHVYTGTFVSNANVPSSTKRYQITKKPIGTNDFVVFEVSELIRDYLQIEFNGVYNGYNVWVNIISTAVGGSGSTVIEPDTANGFTGFDGYGYFEEGANPIITTPVFLSNNTILKLDNSSISIPLNTFNVQSANYLLNGVILKTEFISTSTNSSEQIKYIINTVYASGAFQKRVVTDGGTFEYKFKEFFYEVYHKGIVRKNELAFDENFQNFDLKYSEDIQTIFEKYKEMEKAYALDLFRDKSYDHLIEFLYEYFDIMEEISDDEDDGSGTKDYLGYNIYD